MNGRYIVTTAGGIGHASRYDSAAASATRAPLGRVMSGTDASLMPEKPLATASGHAVPCGTLDPDAR